jgi:hypothetical protein
MVDFSLLMRTAPRGSQPHGAFRQLFKFNQKGRDGFS